MAEYGNGDYVQGPKEMTPEAALDLYVVFGRRTNELISQILSHDHRKGPHPQGMYRRVEPSPIVTDPRKTPTKLELIAVAIPVDVLKALVHAGGILADEREMKRREGDADA